MSCFLYGVASSLGLVVDTVACQKSEPADKSNQQATSRRPAGAAGVLMSPAPAVHMASVQLPNLDHAMQSEARWDTLVAQLVLMQKDLQYWL